MTNKLHRLFALLLTLIMVASMLPMTALADPDDYTVGSTYRLNYNDATKLPALNEGLEWTGPVTSSELSCGMNEHQHPSIYCSFTPTYENPGEGNYSSTSTEYYVFNYALWVWDWEKVSKTEYDGYVLVNDPWGLKEGDGLFDNHYTKTVYYKYTCVNHTHGDNCYTTYYTWTVAEKAKYTVTYAWADETNVPEDATLPTDTNSYYAGSTVTVAENPTSTSTANGDLQGTWTFDGWTASPELGENNAMPASNVTFVGGWTFTEYDKYTVTYAWADETNVPADATLPTDTNSYYAGSTVTVAENPTSTSTANGDLQGTWTFDGWTASPELGENNAMPADNVTFVGGWTFTEDTKYNVTYKFVSGTEGRNLPTNVTAQLPENGSVYAGATATADAAFRNVNEMVNGVTVGTWKFKGWEPREVENVQAAVEFVGTWVFTEAPKYTVTYAWADANNVPADATLPTDTNSYYAGSIVTVAENPTSTSNKKGDLQGTWTFDGWTASPELGENNTMPAGNVTIVGTWEFTEDPKGKLVYAWKEGTEVPADAVLPTDDSYYYVGSTVTVAENPTSTSTVNGEMQGTWKFLGWDTSVLPDGKMPEGAEKVIIEGEWQFTEANKYSYTLIYNGNGGVSGTETSLKDSENVENVYATSAEMTVDDCAFTLDRYEFQGWAESLEDAANGIATIQPGEKITFTPNMTSKTLYAVWKKVVFTITVNKTSTGYNFKDGDNLSFSVSINGDILNETESISYSAENGWGSFDIDNVREGNVITVTELGPDKNNYIVEVYDANGNHVAAKKGDYAQTITVSDDATITFVNKYTPYAEEYTPTPVVPTTPDIPATGDSASITVAAAMILMGAMVAFVAMRKREN